MILLQTYLEEFSCTHNDDLLTNVFGGFFQHILLTSLLLQFFFLKGNLLLFKGELAVFLKENGTDEASWALLTGI